jgi:hypothetical protein
VEHYWRLKDMPELRCLPAKLRRQWWREAVVRSRTHRNALLWLGVYVVCFSAVLTFGDALGLRAGLPHWLVLFASVLFAQLLVEHWLIQPYARQWLRERFDTHGTPTADRPEA